MATQTQATRDGTQGSKYDGDLSQYSSVQLQSFQPHCMASDNPHACSHPDTLSDELPDRQ